MLNNLAPITQTNRRPTLDSYGLQKSTIAYGKNFHR